MLNGGPISWSSCKQPLITLSTVEAEYIGLTTLAREIPYLQLLIGELYGPLTTPTPFYCDNQSAITLASNGKFQSCTKHIDLRYHFVHSHVRNGTFDLIYCPSEENVADVFTKPLPHPHLEKLRSMMKVECARGGVLNGMPDASE
jgi:hypothetical protein